MEDTKLCDNCQAQVRVIPFAAWTGRIQDIRINSTALTGCVAAQVPAASFERHEAFCRRNIFRCTTCGEAVRIADRDDHERTQHAVTVCECAESVEASKLEAHRANTCKVHAFEECLECKASLPKGTLDVHQRDSCIYRQVPCEWCAMPLPMLDMADHKVCGRHARGLTTRHSKRMLRGRPLTHGGQQGLLRQPHRALRRVPAIYRHPAYGRPPGRRLRRPLGGRRPR